MMSSDAIRPSPWDTEAFRLPCFEITDASPQVLDRALRTAGHYTVKIDPTASKEALNSHGFYYCDTLIEPFCTKSQFILRPHPEAAITWSTSMAELAPICANAFDHGRFHRDFNLPTEASEKRYLNWLEQLHTEGQVMGLVFEGKTIGFIACKDRCFVLHAIHRDFRGKGLAKHLWTAACLEMFAADDDEIYSSVSAANLTVVNLYASLGFRFRNPKDVYHCMVSETR